MVGFEVGTSLSEKLKGIQRPRVGIKPIGHTGFIYPPDEALYLSVAGRSKATKNVLFESVYVGDIYESFTDFGNWLASPNDRLDGALAPTDLVVAKDREPVRHGAGNLGLFLL